MIGLPTREIPKRGEPKRVTEEENGGLLIALTQRVETIEEEKGGCKVYLF